MHPQLIYHLKQPESGVTLIELMLVIAIITTLAAIAVPSFGQYVNTTKKARAVMELKTIQSEFNAYEAEGRLPATLADIGKAGLRDPWGNPYQYQNFSLVPKGKWRKDRFLVPINSTYDLWSMGPDGQSRPPLTAKHSRDDIIRANDGGYIGPAERY